MTSRKRDKSKGTKQRSTLREYFEALVVAGIFLGFTNTFVLKTFFIPSASMEDTLLIGDHLFVNRFIYGARSSPLLDKILPLRPLERGDVVVFRSVEHEGMDLVKRCVALPGDRVSMIDKELFINDQRVEDDSYTKNDASENYRRDNFGPITIPDDRYFCMGDNRDKSHDSRYWGTLPARNVKGRAFMVYWSYGGGTPDGNWHGWTHRFKQLASTMVGFLTKTRWARSFHLIR